MAREGAGIVICDINSDTLPTAAAEIEALGRPCLALRCDVSSSAIPLGRLGKPEEYASLALYLATDEHYLVGQTISPNGGMIL